MYKLFSHVVMISGHVLWLSTTAWCMLSARNAFEIIPLTNVMSTLDKPQPVDSSQCLSLMASSVASIFLQCTCTVVWMEHSSMDYQCYLSTEALLLVLHMYLLWTNLHIKTQEDSNYSIHFGMV